MTREATEMEQRCIDAIVNAPEIQAAEFADIRISLNFVKLVVRKTIRAMREPTEDMLAAGEPVVYDCYSLEPGEGLDQNPAQPTWQAMIDAASPPE